MTRRPLAAVVADVANLSDSVDIEHRHRQRRANLFDRKLLLVACQMERQREKRHDRQCKDNSSIRQVPV